MAVIETCDYYNALSENTTYSVCVARLLTVYCHPVSVGGGQRPASHKIMFMVMIMNSTIHYIIKY